MRILDRFLSKLNSLRINYLDDNHLSKLKDYKYRSIDLSFITKYILKHWWEFVTSQMPIWLAPNLITLIGLLFIIVNLITVIIYDSDLKTDLNGWIYFSFALGLFAYQTLDNVDGKQARRTGTSSPLGELFDHGIDSLNCVLGGLIQCSAIGTGHTFYAVFIIVVACWPMYLSTWEEYHTGVLFLGYINGPTEGILIAIAILLNSSFNGIKLWHLPVEDFINVPGPILNLFKSYGHQLLFIDLFVLFVLWALFVGHAPACLYNTFRAIKVNRALSQSERDPRLCLISQAIFRLLPLIVFTTCSVFWILSPYSILLERSKTIEFGLMLCAIFGRISTRTILSHLTKSSFPFWSNTMIPLIGGFVLINLPVLGLPRLITPFGELILLRLSVFFSLVGYLISSYETVDRFCKVLNINCLTIKKRESSFKKIS
ncbi:CDP-alcohol phosphatidyltransferase-domain-containing protein [Phakopsora pachyrhizi]|uniref:CDP-alcohol phosphatidyltransferase-domain-containing protein n=1 Tax=Phakopsora pachyrhizi TaxID=170000 RepID=A0AAV0AT01_PHAPC|nr:CDP-alcohol phosphatidyltransferase-domain-containing protein [Phakopsora pachyrhizi]CAH7670949.1 CDP-alcohol phosphatidyltransferase-domain-containing protein [Phakopsora pachyrhizi]